MNLFSIEMYNYLRIVGTVSQLDDEGVSSWYNG